MFGVRIDVEFSFLVFLSLIFLVKDSLTICGFFTVCLAHETGHAAALYLTGGRLSSLIFCGTGLKMIPERYRIFPVRNELIVLLAGPAVNLIIFAALNAFSPGNTFALMNLCAAVFNLLPYSSLDGGAALNLIFGYRESCAPIMTAFRLLPVILGVYSVIAFGNTFLALLCVMMFYFLNEFR